MRGLLLIALLTPQLLLAQKAVAVVMYAAGDRAHIQGGQSVDLEPQDLVRPGDEIETGADGKVSLQCSTGVIFQIGPNSHIKVNDLTSAGSQETVFIRLETGTLGTIVNRAENAQHVQITTPTAVANVRGTAFLVEAEQEETNILVQEGEVEVEDEAGNKGRARAGRYIRARRREALRDELLDDARKRRMTVLAEVRARRDARFKERVERLRNAKERVKIRRDRIQKLREDRKDARDRLRDRRDAREKDRRDLKDRDRPRDPRRTDRPGSGRR